MTISEFNEIMKKETKEEYKKDPYPPLNAQRAVNILARHFLGDDWYIVDPVNNEEGNTIEVHEILKRFPQRKDKIKNAKSWLRNKLLKYLE